MLAGRIPKEWDYVLNLIQKQFPKAIIAGGALRDLDNGRSIKDVDIFIPTSISGTVQELYNAVREHYIFADATLSFASYIDGEEQEVPEEHEDRALDGIVFFEYAGYKFECIVCKPAFADISSFDINICQIKYDGSCVIKTEAYERGVRDNYIRIVTQNRQDRNAARLARIAVKYPDWAFDDN